MERVKKIISSYNKKTLFVAEEDQYCKAHLEIIDDLKRKFYNARSRKDDQLIYQSQNINIAVHIRRGDIVIGQSTNNSNLLMRWQNTSYFENVLSRILDTLKASNNVHVYIFSQGKEEEFSVFNKFKNIHLCLDMNEKSSFLHLVHADIIVSSKSGFSFWPS